MLSDECDACCCYSSCTARWRHEQMRKRRCPTNEATLAAQWCSTATLSRCSVCVDAQNGFSESAIISREVSLALPKGKENLSAQLPRESDGGRAGGRTAEAPQYAAEACIKQKPPLTQSRSPASDSRRP